MFVFDDEYAIVGSANANNRSYFHDSEASVGIAERAFDKPDGARGGHWFAAEANFARRLRIKLWEEHLRFPAEELFDGVGARVLWDLPNPQARVQVYQAIDMNAQGKPKDIYAKELPSIADPTTSEGAPIMKQRL